MNDEQLLVNRPSDQRFSRHIGLSGIGADGQQRLCGSTALIVGLGGLGAPAALYLASSGVGQLVLNDFDRIDITNLPRQILFRAEEVGDFKSDVTAEKLAATNPDTVFTALNQRLSETELAEVMTDCDVVLDCTDTFASRTLVNAACIATRTPLVSGAAIRFEGQLAVFRADNTGGPCYRCLYSEEDENLENCEGQGILAPLAGTIGCMMATEAIKLLAGLKTGMEGKLWVYDGLTGSTRCLSIPRRPDCPACAGSAGGA
jgi:molybdopterin/thiamine biosynthesis adenylyltransferase